MDVKQYFQRIKGIKLRKNLTLDLTYECDKKLM